MIPWRMPLACALFAIVSAAQPATVTGRVFDTYHRPVKQATVATMERKITDGKEHLVPALTAIVDDAGMYRLSVPAGRYILAVLPPPHGLDRAVVFPSYFQDASEFDKAQPVDVSPGEIRPFTDFLLLEVESHSLSGRVTGLQKRWGAAGIGLSFASGYAGTLLETLTDRRGRFQFDHVPAGSYILKAFAPAWSHEGAPLLWGGEAVGTIQIDVGAPKIDDLRIHLHRVAR